MRILLCRGCDEFGLANAYWDVVLKHTGARANEDTRSDNPLPEGSGRRLFHCLMRGLIDGFSIRGNWGKLFTGPRDTEALALKCPPVGVFAAKRTVELFWV